MKFRVGVTGHRWNGLKEANVSILNGQIMMVLEYIHRTVRHTDASASLQLLSPLAEGSDRIVAKNALNLDYTLHCILPFARSSYEEDFESSESKQEFRELLEEAREVLELPNHPDSSKTRNAAYTSAGRAVTAQSDILLAIWDGEKARGEGGTGQMVEEALAQNRLVVWINSKAPHDVYWLRKGRRQESLSALSEHIQTAVSQKKSYSLP